jgi:F-type H+-transporting ATPase subunit gamma
MTRRRHLEQHRHSLTEIGGIMNSMKTLAYMEIQKLAHCLDAQKTVVQSIEEVAADFLSFHAESLPEAKEALPVYVLIGSQRGFCSDFNHALLRHFESAENESKTGAPALIVIGRRLYSLLEGDTRIAAYTDGPGVAEEVTLVLSRVVEALSSLQDQSRMLNVFGLYHGSEGSIVMQKLLPPFQQFLHRAPRFPHPPALNQSPRDFLIGLSDQYLFAALHEMLYASLMAENRQRLTHLEGAVRRLEEQSANLARRCNALRQEEIIEEIEVILLNATGPDQARPETVEASRASR